MSDQCLMPSIADGMENGHSVKHDALSAMNSRSYADTEVICIRGTRLLMLTADTGHAKLDAAFFVSYWRPPSTVQRLCRMQTH